MLGKIVIDGEKGNIPFLDPNTRNLVAEVSRMVKTSITITIILVL